MASDIRLLEELVQKVVERLHQLTDERGRLEEEVRALRDRVGELERSASAGDGSEAAWQTERTEVLSVLRETLSDLRGA